MAEHDKHYAPEEKSSSTEHQTPESVDGNDDAARDVEKHNVGAEATKQETKLSQEERDPNVVDYDGDNDQENPYNWTKTRKWINGGFLSALTFITPLGSSMFTPGVPEVMREFGSSSQLLGSFVVSIYILGYAFGRKFGICGKFV